jgi:hypothetical protein
MILPSILLPWRPAEVMRLTQDLVADNPWVVAGTLTDTGAGERALVYQTTSDQGLVAIIDFARTGTKHPDLGYASWGIWKTLNTPIPRSDLLELDRSTFLRLQGRRRIPESTRRGLATLLGEEQGSLLEGFGVPTWAAADIEWVPAELADTWGIEAAMRDALASHAPTWRQLGFSTAPKTEVTVPGTRDRMDLAGGDPYVVVECKLHVNRATIRQIDRYAEGLRASGQVVRRLHVVAARSYSREAKSDIGARDDVQLWICTRQTDGTPLLSIVN